MKEMKTTFVHKVNEFEHGFPRKKELEETINLIECDSCFQEMEVFKKFETKPRGERKLKYRITRYGCSLCETFMTVYADGYHDKRHIINAVNKAKEL